MTPNTPVYQISLPKLSIAHMDNPMAMGFILKNKILSEAHIHVQNCFPTGYGNEEEQNIDDLLPYEAPEEEQPKKSRSRRQNDRRRQKGETTQSETYSEDGMAR